MNQDLLNIQNNLPPVVQVQPIDQLKLVNTIDYIVQKIQSTVKETSKEAIKESTESIVKELLYLKQREREALEKACRARRERMVNRKRQHLRDAATFHELDICFDVVSNLNTTRYKKSRLRVSLTLLCAFGLRVGSLSLIQVSDIVPLLHSHVNEITLPINKSKHRYLTFIISPTVRLYLEKVREDLKVLMEGKADRDFLISGENKVCRICRSVLSGETNDVLKQVRALTRKYIRSHSFRVGKITSLIQSGGIDVAKKVIGHQDIRTTDL